MGLKENDLYIAAEERLWIRYLKGALRTFKEKYSYIPGFQMVIASNLPSNYDLGKNAALIVAMYMFLETVAHTYTVNILEKALMCHLAEKLAINYPYKARISDVLISVLGKEDKIFITDAQSLHFDQYNWNNIDVELILIELNVERNKSSEWHISKTQYEEIMTVINTQSRWRTHPIGMSMIKYLFPEKTTKMIYDAIDKDKRITKIAYAIQNEQWEKLGRILSNGKLLWKNHEFVCKYLTFLSDDIKHIENTFGIIEGVLGASIINYGTAIVTLVQKSKLKTFLSCLNRTQIPYQKCYLIKACSGATVIYGHEKRITTLLGKKYISRQQIKKYYHLVDYDYHDYEFTSKYEPRYSASLTLPRISFV
ncbi:Galactokinase [Apis cerana cerana]|uniref:Galactokinase n=1 Tax=Apis cerana cerana TaxID=94128 RepID=A0A2A3EBF6_APICC|nr:Galactokinase [Apis cerana cerana]